MDTSKSDKLKARCAELGDAPLVSVEEFFDGNDDAASIGCNLDPHPGMERFRAILTGLGRLPGVTEVLARISEVDPGEENWPFTDTICLVGEVAIEAVREQVAPLQPTEVERIGFFSDGEFKHLAKSRQAPVTVLWWD